MIRGEGATTRQMQAAPQGAVFVWVNHHLDYPKDLARKLDRMDLKIMSPGHAFDDHHLRGRRFPAIILDHACDLTMRQWDEYDAVMYYLKG